MPDLTIILDVPAESRARARHRAARQCTRVDRFEAEAFDFHKKLREAYLELAEREPNRCVVINASADAATVAECVWARSTRGFIRRARRTVIEATGS